MDILQELQDHFDDPYHRGSAEMTTHAAEGLQSETGCQIRVELAVDDEGRVVEAWWDGEGCRYCEGTASLLAERLERRFIGEIEENADWRQLCQAVNAAQMQACEAPPPQGCGEMVAKVWLAALRSPLAALDDDLADGQQFGGPSLREEC